MGFILWVIAVVLVVAGIVQLVALLAVFIPLIALLVRDARVPQRAADERVPAL